MVYCIQIKHHIRYTAFGDIFMVQMHTSLGHPYAVYRMWINIHLLYTEYGAPCMENSIFYLGYHLCYSVYSEPSKYGISHMVHRMLRI